MRGKLPMKLKRTLIISFKSLDELESETLEIFKTRRPKIQPKNVIFFDNLKGFREFMTVQKLELLAVIAAKKPKSVYALAQLIERDTSAVQRDCTILMNTGFIVLEESKSSRGSKIPRLKFDYNKIVVELPKLSYEISFKIAA
jgi:predicted transcriptional regulator